jgi:DNA-binding MarR family transcriptional regulator
MLDKPSVSSSPGKLPAAIENRLVLLLASAELAIEAAAADGLHALNLTARQYCALAFLADDKPASQQELAGLMGLLPALVVPIVDELVERDLILRERDPDDRRRHRLALTSAGIRVLADADRLAKTVERNVLGSLDDDTRERLRLDLIRALKAADNREDPDATVATTRTDLVCRRDADD